MSASVIRRALRRRTPSSAAPAAEGLLSTKSLSSGRVCCSGWILLMASLVTGRTCRQSEKGITATPVPAWNFQPVPIASATTMRDQAGPSPRGHEHAPLHRPAPILLRRRSARQKPVSSTSSTTREDRLRPGPARLARRLPRRRRSPSATASSSAPSACSPGTGSPTCASDEAHPLRPRPRPGHEGHPRRQGQERPDRRRQARRPAPRRPVPDGLRLPARPSGRPATCSAAGRFFVRQRAQLIAHISNTNTPVQPAAAVARSSPTRATAPPRSPTASTDPSTRLIGRRRPGPDRRLRHADRRAGDGTW